MPDHRRERGAVTAEIAVALPAVVLVLVAVVAVVLAASTQLRVADAARAGARAASAGESDARVVEVAQHLAGARATVTVTRAAPWVTVEVDHPVVGGWTVGGPAARSTATAWLETGLEPAGPR